MKTHLSIETAKVAVKSSGKEFAVLFEHGSLSVELYKPNRVDKQTPHTRDETYIIVSGESKFSLNNEATSVSPGDFLFVPAHAKHYFFDFTDDFSTWVLFYGPEGGDK